MNGRSRIEHLVGFVVATMLHAGVVLAQQGAPADTRDGTGQAPQSKAAQQACLNEFTSHRAEFEQRAKAFQSATKAKQRPTPDQACKLITSLAQSVKRWRAFVDRNRASCGMPTEVGPQIANYEVRIAVVEKSLCQASERQRSPRYLPDPEHLFPPRFDPPEPPRMRIAG